MVSSCNPHSRSLVIPQEFALELEHEFSSPLQGTVKTRYFLLYLERMRVRHFSRDGVLLCVWVGTRRGTSTKGEEDSSYRCCAQNIVSGTCFQRFPRTALSLGKKPQGTVKTRYFLLYLERMRVHKHRECFLGCRSQSCKKRATRFGAWRAFAQKLLNAFRSSSRLGLSS